MSLNCGRKVFDFFFMKDWKEKFTDDTLYLSKHNPAACKYIQQNTGILHQQNKQKES